MTRKAVALISGGLDSALAAKVVQQQGVEVLGLYFALPWGCGQQPRAQHLADQLGMCLRIFPLAEDYLQVLRRPRFGYGTAFNPCMDCHLYMMNKAFEYMAETGASFVVTGEVIGQRPMSQRRPNLQRIDKFLSKPGFLLRPLCALRLEETVPEQKGWVDRGKLLGLNGRGRREQFRLAEQWGLTGYSTPAGGCLLTEKPFAAKLRDTFHHGYRDLRDLSIIKYGRYFRLNEQVKCLVGRDEKENGHLVELAHDQDMIIKFKDCEGPTVVLQGGGLDEEVLALAGGVVQRFSKYRGQAAKEMQGFHKGQANEPRIYTAAKVTEQELERMSVR